MKTIGSELQRRHLQEGGSSAPSAFQEKRPFHPQIQTTIQTLKQRSERAIKMVHLSDENMNTNKRTGSRIAQSPLTNEMMSNHVTDGIIEANLKPLTTNCETKALNGRRRLFQDSL